MDIQVSIGQVKRDISELVNRVAFGKARIVLTSRGKPKAVIISVADYERLNRQEGEPRLEQWQSWLKRSKVLSEDIGSVDVDKLWEAAHADLEARNDHLFGD